MPASMLHDLPADQLETLILQKNPRRRDLLDLGDRKAAPWHPLGCIRGEMSDLSDGSCLRRDPIPVGKVPTACAG